MDGLSRRLVQFSPIAFKRMLSRAEQMSDAGVLAEDKDVTINAYVVGGQDGMNTWGTSSSVIHEHNITIYY